MKEDIFTIYNLRFSIYNLPFTIYDLSFTIYDGNDLSVGTKPQRGDGI